MEPKSISDIREILILGAGTMGLRIGLQSAISGFDVTIYDVSAEAFERAKGFQEGILKSLIKHKMLGESDLQPIRDKIHWTTDLREACQSADLVNESVPENLELKKQIWKNVGEFCPEHTIFTTNTSYLLPSAFATDSGRPQHFCGFHFHDVFYANVVDVMPHAETVKWIPPLLMELGKLLRQTPVMIQKESSGYIFNAMLVSLLTSAGKLVTSGIASPQDVDKSWMGNFKMDMGPFGIIDSIGLDTAWHVTHNQNSEDSKPFAALLKDFVDQGKLGVKTGEGFYQYPNPAFKEFFK